MLYIRKYYALLTLFSLRYCLPDTLIIDTPAMITDDYAFSLLSRYLPRMLYYAYASVFAAMLRYACQSYDATMLRPLTLPTLMPLRSLLPATRYATCHIAADYCQLALI